MKIACIGYRDWAIEIYNNLIESTDNNFLRFNSKKEFSEKKLKLLEQRIKIIRIDDLELNPILIKIDIEGGEVSALKGMEKTLKLNHLKHR